jgi:hypothetical protein
MMIRARATVGLLAILVAGPAGAATVETHSGAVRAVDLERHTVTIEEMGPWRGPGSHPTRRSIRFTTKTTVDLVRRPVTPPPGRWPGGYVESPSTMGEVRPGDFVSATVTRHDGRITARAIDVVRPAER